MRRLQAGLRHPLLRGWSIGLVSALATTGLLASAAQDERSPGGIPVSRVRRDVLVVDQRGHAILGLRPADFVVLEDGARRPIVSVEFHRRGSPDPPPVETDHDAARAARQPGTRVFAFFLDELHVSAANADLVRRTVAAFIEEKLEAGDLVGVMKPFDAADSVRFTRDRALAHGVIASFEGRKGDDRPRTTHEARVLEANAGGGGRDHIVKTGLRALALRLGELNAERPVLVVFSEGFPAETAANRMPMGDLGGLLRAASRFHITTFAFNPAPVAAQSGVSREEATNRQTLKWLAEETGGRAVDAEQFIYGVARLFHDTEGYYALTYRPAEPNGEFRALDIRVRRSGAFVLTHRGHWAMRESDWRQVIALPGIAAPPTHRSLRRSPLVDVWVGIYRDTAGVPGLLMTWEPRRSPRGSAQVIRVKASSIEGASLFEGEVAPLGPASASDANIADFEAPSGRVELDIVILDAHETVLDTDVRNVDVPEFRSSSTGAPLVLPMWLVRSLTPRGLQLASTGLQARPAASRTFHRSEYLLVRVPVFDPTGQGARVSAVLLNQRGLSMRVLDALGHPREDVTDFGLPLAILAPGEYQLEVRAVNRRGVATERLTFRIVG